MSVYYQPGVYRCRIISQSFAEAGTGTQQFVLKFTVLESIEPSEKLQQYERKAYFSLTNNTVGWVLHDLQTLGYPGTTLLGLDPLEDKFYDFAGQEVEMRCRHEEGRKKDDEPRERWSVASENLKPANKDTLHALDKFLANVSAPLDSSGLTDDDVPY